MSLFLLIGTVGILIYFFFTIKTGVKELTGIYWGAFDPPTKAHSAIIAKAINDIPLRKLVVVVNNHPYKNYQYSLTERLDMMKIILQQHGLEKVELLWQDESHQMDAIALKAIIQGPLCAIAGYDAYKKWVSYSALQDRSHYDAIAVIPRGDEAPILFDKMAFLLPIDSKYKDVSSTKVRNSLCRKINDNVCNDSAERSISTK